MNSPSSEVAAEPPDSGDSIGRNTAFALATQFTTAAFTAALTLYLVRALGPYGYGLFALATGIGSLLLLPSDFGITASSARFMAERRGDGGAVAAVFADALRLKLIAATVVSGALMAAAGPIANAYGEPGLTWPLRFIAVALFGQSMMQFFSGTFVALGRISVNLRLVFSESLLEASASFALVLLAGGAGAAAAGRAVGYAFGAAVGLALAMRALGRPKLSRRARGHSPTRQIAGYAGSLLIIDGAFTLFSQLDALLIGSILGATSVGLFQAPVRFTIFLQHPGLSVASAVAPRLARREGHPPAVREFAASIRYLILYQALLIAPVVIWARPITELLLGDGYEESAEVLRALAPFIFLSGLAPLLSLAVNYLGEARRRVPIAIGAVIVNVVLDLILIPSMGIVGAAVGTGVAYALYVPAHFLICRQMLDLPLRPIAVTLARSLLAASAMAGVLALFGTDELSPLEWIAGALGGVAAFASVLVASRELTGHEVRSGLLAGGRLRRR